MLKAEGLDVGMIRPQTLFPFPEKAIKEAVSKSSCKAAISVELNMGQMVEDVERSVQGVCAVHWYGKAGGDVPTPEEIISAVKPLSK
jgi:2-oxoglutarate ferredoxin oxidoreductase subunit alpha